MPTIIKFTGEPVIVQMPDGSTVRVGTDWNDNPLAVEIQFHDGRTPTAELEGYHLSYTHKLGEAFDAEWGLEYLARCGRGQVINGARFKS